MKPVLLDHSRHRFTCKRTSPVEPGSSEARELSSARRTVERRTRVTSRCWFLALGSLPSRKESQSRRAHSPSAISAR